MTFETRLPASGKRSHLRGLLRNVLLLFIAASVAAVWLTSSEAGQSLLLKARIRWAAFAGPARAAGIARLFGSSLTRSLYTAGIDTSLIRYEPAPPGASSKARWEIPLPDGFATSRGNALVTRAVERFGGRIEDGIEPARNRVLLSASLYPGTHAEIVLMGKDAPLGGAPRLAILVDGFGNRNMAESEALMDMGRGLSVAILPHTTGARDLAVQCRAHGLEVLLNLPMEGLDYPRVDPGPGAILVDMAPGEIRKRVSRALDQIGGASGVHTYLGELAVEDRDVMRAVLQAVADRHGYFVESTSSSFSVVRETAAGVGTPSLKLRDVIDAPGASTARVRQNLEALAGEALERGVAVGLVHPWPATVQSLKELLPEWRKRGIELVPLSEIVTVPRE